MGDRAGSSPVIRILDVTVREKSAAADACFVFSDSAEIAAVQLIIFLQTPFTIESVFRNAAEGVLFFVLCAGGKIEEWKHDKRKV